MKYSKSEYKFIKFEPSSRKNKKYMAVIQNKKTGDYKYIHFGDSRYEHYQDNTGLKLWSHKDHKDKKRLIAFHKRHKHNVNPNYYSPAYFSFMFLW